MIAEILDWLNHQWVLSIFLSGFAVVGVPTLLYIMWDERRMKKERDHYED